MLEVWEIHLLKFAQCSVMYTVCCLLLVYGKCAGAIMLRFDLRVLLL